MGSALGYLSDLTGTVTDILRDGLDLLATRLELMSLELQEEKARMVGLIVWTALAVLFAVLAIVMITFSVIYLLEARHRAVALLVFTAVYVLASVVSFLVIRRKLLATKPFAQTLEEFRKDRECL